MDNFTLGGLQIPIMGTPDPSRRKKKYDMTKGQDRTRRLNDVLDYYIPPELKQRLNTVAMFNPVNDAYEAMGDARDGNYGRAAVNTLTAAAPAMGYAAAKAVNPMMDDVIGATVDTLTGLPVVSGVEDAARRFVADEYGGINRTAGEAQAQDVLDMIRAGRASEVTDDMMAAADDMYLYQNYDLPMDEASRMQRAREGWPIEGYHSTRSDFSEFKKGDLGYHIGTSEQANQRLRQTEMERGTDGAQVIPTMYRMDNPLRTRDAGEWNDARRAGKIVNSAGVDVQDIVDEATDIALNNYEANDYWKLSPDNEEMLREITRDVEAAGFDGIRYANEVENAYGNLAGKSDIIFDPANIRSRFARFDPRLKHLRNLSAGLMGYAMLPQDQYE